MPWRQHTQAASSTIQTEVKSIKDASTDQSSSQPAQPQSSFVEVIDATAQPQAQPASESASFDSSSIAAEDKGKAETEVPHVRSLAWRNFEQALKEITPSASEALGSLAELRKWNDEFGEGRKAKKRQVWGKDRFGFTVPPLEVASPSDGRTEPGVATPANFSQGSSISETTASS